MGLLDLIIKETVEQVFVEELEVVIPGDDDVDADDAASPSSAPAAEVDKEAILRSVVRKHLGELDGLFMAAPPAYVQVAESRGDFALLSMLAAIREEVLAAVTGEMQPDIQVVQLVSRLKSREQRVEVLRAARHPAAGPWPGCASRRRPSPVERSPRGWSTRWNRRSAAGTGTKAAVAARCWSSETARCAPAVRDDGVFGATVVSRSCSPSEIPKAEAAMIKELCVVNESLARRARARRAGRVPRAGRGARRRGGAAPQAVRPTLGVPGENDDGTTTRLDV